MPWRLPLAPRLSLFFNDSIRNSGATRREFLRNMAVGAALVTLAGCGGGGSEPAAEDDAAPVDTSNLEKTDLQIGFIPITCASPIIMSEPLGFYEKHGLNATVVKMPSWGAVRDSAIAGELDAYHMLAPMPIAMTLGLGLCLLWGEAGQYREHQRSGHYGRESS
jgi:nitrate/nitrite transport system substrate-binding protein